MTRRIKVRFNLGRGENYKKWKVSYPDGTTMYYTPDGVSLQMTGCTLKNQKSTAQKIHAGADKTVCAWVLCESLEISGVIFGRAMEAVHIQYNPRATPNWLCDGSIVDNQNYRFLFTNSNKLFIG